MLIKATEQQIDEYVDFAYNLSQNGQTSSYPSFRDGIKSKQDFVRAAHFAIDSPTEEILLYQAGGSVQGWIHWYLLSDENAVTFYTCLCNGEYQQMFAEFVQYAKAKFPTAEISCGFPAENVDAVAAMEHLGFALEERSYNCVLHLDEYSPRDCSTNVTKIGKNDFDKFRALHDGIDMYWTSERIYDRFEQWSVYVYEQDGRALGAIYCMDESILLEIFGIDYVGGTYDKGVGEALLVTLLNDSKKQDKKHIVYFAETLREGKNICDLGFKIIDEYTYWTKKNL